jgi:hypothetical protein
MKAVRAKPGIFRDRREAGRLLAEKLAAYAHRPDVLVLALPRGGVPVAYEVARALGAPLGRGFRPRPGRDASQLLPIIQSLDKARWIRSAHVIQATR